MDAPVAAALRATVIGQHLLLGQEVLHLPDFGSLPTAAEEWRGMFAFVYGGAGVADDLYICRKNAAGAYEWRLAT